MFADCDIVQSSYLSRLYVIALELLGLGVQSNNNFFNKKGYCQTRLAQERVDDL